MLRFIRKFRNLSLTQSSSIELPVEEAQTQIQNGPESKTQDGVGSERATIPVSLFVIACFQYFLQR